MSSKLQQELKQTKPFESLKREVLVNLARTTAFVTYEAELALRAHGLTFLQYNVLRIIRGAGSAGIIQGDIRERLVTPIGDVPRVLVRLEKLKLVRRTSDSGDRRFLNVVLTSSGLALLAEVDRAQQKMDEKLFVNLSEEQLTALNELLVAAR